MTHNRISEERDATVLVNKAKREEDRAAKVKAAIAKKAANVNVSVDKAAGKAASLVKRKKCSSKKRSMSDKKIDGKKKGTA